MALCPFAAVKLLPQNYKQRAIKPRAVIFHTAVDPGHAHSLFGWFQSPGAGGAEATFYVNQAGNLEQYMDTEVCADAQFTGNSFAISIETDDGGDPSTPWNPAQLATLIRVSKWCCDEHPAIPSRAITAPDGSGFGYHQQFPQWNRDGHNCPGPVRVAQVPLIIAAVARAVPDLPPPPPQEADVLDVRFVRVDGDPAVYLVNGAGADPYHVTSLKDQRYIISTSSNTRLLMPPDGATTDAPESPDVWVLAKGSWSP